MLDRRPFCVTSQCRRTRSTAKIVVVSKLVTKIATAIFLPRTPSTPAPSDALHLADETDICDGKRADSFRTLVDLGQITERAAYTHDHVPGTAMCHRETSPIFGFREEKARSLGSFSR